MKSKNIKSVCKNKINDLADHIKDPVVADMVRKNSIITGGAIASMLLGEPVNDFDVYFRTRAVALAVAKYFVAQFLAVKKLKFKDGRQIECHIDESRDDRISVKVRSSGVASSKTDDDYQYFEHTDPESGDADDYAEKAVALNKESEDEDNKYGKYRVTFLSTNAITLANKVQLVLRFYGEPKDIHDNYDFIHCTNVWTSWDGVLNLNPLALEALLAKDLRYVGSKYPICSLIRIRKFLNRGWKISAGQILKIAFNLQKFNLSDIHVLQDQLTGVDAAYFDQVIKALKEKDDKVVDTAYLVELIDRLF